MKITEKNTVAHCELASLRVGDTFIFAGWPKRDVYMVVAEAEAIRHTSVATVVCLRDGRLKDESVAEAVIPVEASLMFELKRPS